MTHSTSRNLYPSVGLRTTWTVLSGNGIVREKVEVRDNGGDPPPPKELVPEAEYCKGDVDDVGVVAIALLTCTHTSRRAEEFFVLYVGDQSIGECGVGDEGTA